MTGATLPDNDRLWGVPKHALLDHPSPTGVASESQLQPVFCHGDSRCSHLPCLLIDFLASLRDPLNGLLVLWEKRVISDLLSWKWERLKGQAKLILRKVVYAGGCVVVGCPHPPHAVMSLGFMCPVSWDPPRSKKVRQTMLPFSFTASLHRDPIEGAKTHGIYGRLETQLLFPSSPWQHTQNHWNPPLKWWEWARMPKNKTTMGLKVPCSWQFFVIMENTING